jgi:hypothetical protein
MKNTLVAGLVAVGFLSQAAQALTLAPGQSGLANGFLVSPSGITLASNTSDYFEALSDAIAIRQFTTSVTQSSGGQYVFTYTISPRANDQFVAVPHSLTLAGFGGVATDVYVYTGPGTEATTWSVSRSADGATLTFDAANQNADSFASIFSVEVRTDASSFALGPTTFQPTYWIDLLAPPDIQTRFEQTFPTAAYAPTLAAAIPEPMSVGMLALGVAGLMLRFRRR